MPEHRVIPMNLLMEWPRSMAQDYEQNFADCLAAALEKMAAEGWELVSIYVYHQHLGPGYAIFRRRQASLPNS